LGNIEKPGGRIRAQTHQWFARNWRAIQVGLWLVGDAAAGSLVCLPPLDFRGDLASLLARGRNELFCAT